MITELRRVAACWENSTSWKITRLLRELRAAISRHRTSGQADALVASLQLLNDTLAGTELAGHYWMCGGQLLAWAREGKPLAQDLRDADFCLLADDLPRFMSAVPAISAAGFNPYVRCITNGGRAMVYQFERNDAQFDFFLVDRRDSDLRFYTFEFSWAPLLSLSDDPELQILASIPDQQLVPFQFVGRTWLKHADHEAELRAVYGDDLARSPGWSWIRDSPAIVERVHWERADESVWSGDFGDLATDGVTL